MTEKNVAVATILLFLLTLSVVKPLFPVAASEEPNSGNITFQPNTIPFTSVTFNDSRFVFDWLDNHMEIGMALSIEDLEYEVKVEADKFKVKVKIGDVEYEFEAEAGVVVEKFESNVTWGLNVFDIPELLANYTDTFSFKIMNSSFNKSEIELEVIEFFELGYNITRLHLPDNLALSYEDLWLYNFTVSHPNKLDTIVKGVKGKTNWNFDPITFSANIIQVTGYTEGTPCNFWDLWNASNVNGWDVVWNNRDNNTQFQFDCLTVRIGNMEETETWFADENVQVTFTLSAINSNMVVYSNAHLRYGTLVDETLKLSKDGVCHISLLTTGTLRMINTVAGADIKIYSSKFKSHSAYGRLNLITNNRVWETDIEGSIYGVGAGIELYRVTVKGAFYGLEAVQGEFEDLLIHSTSYAMKYTYSESGTLTNCVFKDNGYLALLYLWTVDVNLVNVESDTWTFYWLSTCTGEVYRKYMFDLTVQFPNGTAIPNANVTISNDYLGTSDSWLTYNNGSIPKQTYSMGHYNQTGANTLYDYNPYNLTIIKDGYQTYSGNFTLSAETDWTITLSESPSPVARFTYAPSNPEPSETITFNATESISYDGIVSYFWDFGDGANTTGVTTTHNYTSEGSYPVNLTVTDNQGLNDTVTHIITVEAPAPPPVPPPPPRVYYAPKRYDLTVFAKDQWKYPIEGVTVTIYRAGILFRSGETDEYGRYLAKDISQGTYEVVTSYKSVTKRETVILTTDMMVIHEYGLLPTQLILAFLIRNLWYLLILIVTTIIVYVVPHKKKGAILIFTLGLTLIIVHYILVSPFP